MTFLRFGRDICGDLAAAARREWIVTNSIGGYASGTVAGVPTRHYHGLLIAALNPPLGRTLLFSKLDETAIYQDRTYRLFTNQWEDGAVEPSGYKRTESFRLEGTTPVWRFALGDALLEKRVWMEQGVNTTYVTYTLERAQAPIELRLKAIVNYRDHHSGTSAGEWHMQVTALPDGLRITAFDDAVPFTLRSDHAAAEPQHNWLRGAYKRVEAYRGLSALDDSLHAGDFTVTLAPGERVGITASSTPELPVLDFDAAYARRRSYEAQLKQIAGLENQSLPVQHLALAADQFIVKRGDGHTVIAGYPWFSDWGRDTMIALPGLTLSTERPKIAASILRTFAQFVDQGMLPNRFPDVGETPEYNTVDATLWYFEAIRQTYVVTEDRELLAELFPVLQDIITWHERGTRYGIRVDPEDGLLRSGEAGVQLTWMDVKIGDWVVTPRTGKAVEINALWYNALRSMADFARELGEAPQAYDQAADRVLTGFKRFWNGSYLYDVIDGPDGNDNRIRPNQLFAVALHHVALPPDQQKAVVDVCSAHLLTSYGLRSLSQDHPDYIGSYGGDSHSRDSAYHQGTVWSWLIGPFVGAHLRVYRDAETARSFLQPLLDHLNDAVLGSVSEIFDGDAPHHPRGAFAQAWGVSELLRAWRLIHDHS